MIAISIEGSKASSGLLGLQFSLSEMNSQAVSFLNPLILQPIRGFLNQVDANLKQVLIGFRTWTKLLDSFSETSFHCAL